MRTASQNRRMRSLASGTTHGATTHPFPPA
jgi:hypothetical protein